MVWHIPYYNVLLLMTIGSWESERVNVNILRIKEKEQVERLVLKLILKLEN